MSLLTELRRRNVFKVGIAYLLFDKFTGSEPYSQDLPRQTEQSDHENRALTPNIRFEQRCAIEAGDLAP